MIRVILEQRGDSIELGSGETILGRAIGCRIRFNDPSVSRRHVRFVVSDHGLTVEDIGSKNGTRVNGELFAGAKPLNDGDRLQIGRRKLRVRLVQGEELLAWEEQTASENPAWEAPPGPAPRMPRPLRELLAERCNERLPEQQNCPKCRKPVAIEADVCPACGFQWPRGRPMSVTEQIRIVEPDRRRSTRVPVDIPVLYSSETLTFDGLARDLSRSGLYLAADLLDDAGTACRLTLLPDGDCGLALSGVVRHVVQSAREDGLPPGMGIEFVELRPVEKLWLEDLMQRKASPT